MHTVGFSIALLTWLFTWSGMDWEKWFRLSHTITFLYISNFIYCSFSFMHFEAMLLATWKFTILYDYHYKGSFFFNSIVLNLRLVDTIMVLAVFFSHLISTSLLILLLSAFPTSSIPRYISSMYYKAVIIFIQFESLLILSGRIFSFTLTNKLLLVLIL